MFGDDDTTNQDAALAAFGLKNSAPPAPVCGIWPDNWPAFRVFYRAMTQWQMGPSGAVGLRYEVLPFLLQLEGVPPSEWADVMTGVQVMEQETLWLWRKN